MIPVLAALLETPSEEIAAVLGELEHVKGALWARLPNGREATRARVVPEYVSLEELAVYSGLSKSTLTKYAKLPPGQALPVYWAPGGGKILVSLREYDEWFAQFRARGRRRVAKALRELGLDNIAV